MAKVLKLGELVREFRRREGWTQAQLASRLGVTERSIRNLEGGLSLGLARMKKLAALMWGEASPDLSQAVQQMTHLTQGEYVPLERRVAELEKRLARLEASTCDGRNCTSSLTCGRATGSETSGFVPSLPQ